MCTVEEGPSGDPPAKTIAGGKLTVQAQTVHD